MIPMPTRILLSLSLIAVMLLFAAPRQARAEDTVVEHFTHSMAMVYMASEMCKNTRESVRNYSTLITNYLNQYYPEGVQYWVLPSMNRYIKSAATCNTMINERLLDYQQASDDFRENYPDDPEPPLLVASSDNTPMTYAPVTRAVSRPVSALPSTLRHDSDSIGQ
jgi:hypothetical protein